LSDSGGLERFDFGLLVEGGGRLAIRLPPAPRPLLPLRPIVHRGRFNSNQAHKGYSTRVPIWCSLDDGVAKTPSLLASLPNTSSSADSPPCVQQATSSDVVPVGRWCCRSTPFVAHDHLVESFASRYFANREDQETPSTAQTVRIATHSSGLRHRGERGRGWMTNALA
jgi:hypothetical protein